MTEKVVQKPHKSNLIWIDLEMTGLEPERDRIIEIATVVTDKHLNLIAEGPVFAIHQDDALLASMDEWNTKTHATSGLVKRVQDSQVDEAQAELETIEFLAQFVPPGKSPMCGNSICQDRRFLIRSMPALAKYFHYRNLDVSTVKLLAKYWAPKVYDTAKKTEARHEALADIYDSISELKHYR